MNTGFLFYILKLTLCSENALTLAQNFLFFFFSLKNETFNKEKGLELLSATPLENLMGKFN